MEDVLGYIEGYVASDFVVDTLKGMGYVLTGNSCKTYPSVEKKEDVVIIDNGVHPNDTPVSVTGYITFTDGGNLRSIWYNYKNWYYKSLRETGTPPFKEYTHINLGSDEEGIRIIKGILKKTGGFIMEDDCNSEKMTFVFPE